VKKSPFNIREELLSSYAIAQYHLGIEITLKAKRKIVGWQELSHASVYKLRKLIKYLREVYKNG
jgi:hypothetical protein